jgi:hypothetical protein
MFSFFKKKAAEPKENLDEIDLIFMRAFPHGIEQVEIETSNLHLALMGALSPEYAKALLVWTKVLLLTAQDLSRERISDGIYRHEEGRLTYDQADLVCCHITGFGESLYSGGDGKHTNEPVIINCSITVVGIWAEKKWLYDHFGVEGKDWNLKSRNHGYSGDGNAHETYEISISNGEEISVHFDISQWYLKN